MRFLKLYQLLLMMLVTTAFGFSNDKSDRLSQFPVKNLPLKGKVTIYWNDYKVPFIEAEYDSDCAFTMGLVHAHLRMSQMHLVRRISQGRLSESAGVFTQDIDHSIRTLDLGKRADDVIAQLPDDVRAWMTTYIDGLNYYQFYVKERPKDMAFLDIDIEPWTLKDIMTMAKLLSADVNWFSWFRWLPLQEKEYWKEIWATYKKYGKKSTPSFEDDDYTLESIIGSNSKAGSNAWVVAGDKTADGHAIMAADPHLGLQMPNAWVITGYKCPSFHSAGLMFAGIPMALVGRNEHLAWGGTNMRSASSDLVEISEDEIVSSRTEIIKTRLWPSNAEVTIRESIHGPVISDIPFFKERTTRLFAFKWMGHQVTDEVTAFFRANQATDWQSFKDAFTTYGVSGQNFLVADDQGGIGQLAAVMLPARPYELGEEFILTSDQATKMWSNILDVHDYPSIYNPKPGFLVSSNNKPFDFKHPVGYFFSANDREAQLKIRLAEKDTLTLEDMKSIQLDVKMLSAERLNNLFLASVDSSWENFEDLEPMLTDLASWQGDYDKNLHAPVAFQAIMFEFINSYFVEKYDEDFANTLFNYDQMNYFLYDEFSALDMATRHKYLMPALDNALDAYEDYETWGEMHKLRLRHPIGFIPLIGRNYNFGEYPTSGSYSTIYKSAHPITNEEHFTTFGAQSRMISMMRDLDENYIVLVGGQDGWIDSPNAADQIEVWLNGEYIHLPMRPETVAKTFTTKMELQGQ
jgi:penicillin amidase